MKYWYFLFEGKLTQEKDYQNLYSSVLLPVSTNEDSETELVRELKEYGVQLMKIEDSFEFVVGDYEEDDEDNIPWFEWFDKVITTREASFTPWQRFR